MIATNTKSTTTSPLKKAVLGSLAVAGSAAVALGVYGFHGTAFQHETHRLLQEIASAKGIHVTLKPNTNSPNAPSGLEVHGYLFPKTIDGQLQFDGRLTYEHVDNQYNFTLLNQRAYVTVEESATGKITRLDCLHPDNIPPIASFTSALAGARVIDAVANPQYNVSCASGKLIEFDFADEPYVLCSQAGSGAADVQGEDLKASLQLLSENSEGVPSLASLAPPGTFDLSKCMAVPTAASTPTRLLLEDVTQRAKDTLQVATGGRRLAKMGTTDCACKGGKKTCLFIHGFGRAVGGDLLDSDKYFPDAENKMQCCSSVKFMNMDTTNNPWWSDVLTEQVCNAAVQLTNAPNRMAIENIALIAHSMGNLIVSAAIFNKKCDLAPSSKWISLAGPIYGTMTSSSILGMLDKLTPEQRQALCDNDPKNPLDDPIANFMEGQGLCTSLISMRSLSYRGTPQSNPTQDALFTRAGEVFKQKVSANVCGTSPVGLLSADSAMMVAQAAISFHKSLENDGQVDFPSCRATIDASRYSTSWSGGAFYKSSLNHKDIALRHGDGWWGNDRKPYKWLNCQF